MLIARWGCFWAVYEGEDLVCVCVYRNGAREVARRLANGRTIIEPGRARRPNGPAKVYAI